MRDGVWCACTRTYPLPTKGLDRKFEIEILFETDTTLQEVQVHWKLKMLFNMIPGTKIIQMVLRH